MEDSLIASIDVMEGGDGVEVSHTRLNTLEELLGSVETEERNLLSCSTNIKNVMVEIQEIDVGRTREGHSSREGSLVLRDLILLKNPLPTFSPVNTSLPTFNLFICTGAFLLDLMDEKMSFGLEESTV